MVIYVKTSNINDDMLMVSHIINTYDYSDYTFKKHDKIYPYTNEIIDGYMNNSKNKTVLSVVGSGDHYLNLVCKGAEVIDSFDINRLSLYYLLLKIAAVKGLSKEDFYEFMTTDSLKHYKKVRPYLDMNSTKFWDYYINKFTSNTGIQNSSLFHLRTHGEQYLASNIYMRDYGYQLLKDNINKHRNELLYPADIYELPSVLDKKYDSIYLSNIIFYQKDIKKYRDLIIELSTFLNNNGELYYGYYYDDNDNNLDYYYKEIPNTDIIEISKSNNKKDKVLVLKK